LQGLESGKAIQPLPSVQKKPQLSPFPIFEAGPGFEPIPWSEKIYDAEHGIGTDTRLVEPKGTEIEEPKPSADEYFKGHAPSVETLAQVGGLIRALIYTFNLPSMGSPEMLRKTEEMADRALPFAYAPEDVARAKHYEQAWAMMFYEMLHMWQFAEPAGDMSLVARRAAANLVESEEAVAASRAAATLRTARARANELVRAARANGEDVVVNIGGAAEPHEPPGAINLNNQVISRRGIPNLVEADGADIGELFAPGSVDRIEGHDMAPGLVDWGRGATGAYRVLRPGGKFEYYYRGANADAAVLGRALRAAGFRNVQVIKDVLVTAIK
jgi:hypothetical protein